jgi:hypothetical protein
MQKSPQYFGVNLGRQVRSSNKKHDFYSEKKQRSFLIVMRSDYEVRLIVVILKTTVCFIGVGPSL